MKKLSVLVLAMLFLFGMATAALAASYNDTTDLVYSNVYLPDTLADDDNDYDNGLKNANKTGVGVGGQAMDQSVIKNVAGQATHGSYQNNTNSCASCHQTHTGAGEMLMFKDSIYTTCTACHDGTLGFYNVFSPSTAGTFAGTQAGNASMHLANGTVEINAAPGGKAGGTSVTGGIQWGSEFNCASCHAPHGSYSDRLLSYNPNGIMSSTTNSAFTAYDPAGKKMVNLNVYGATGEALPEASSAAFTDKAFYFDTRANLEANTDISNRAAVAATFLADIAADDYVGVLLTDGGADWTIDTTPWLYGYENRLTGTYWTQMKKDTVQHTVSGDMAKVIKPLTNKNDLANDATKGAIYMFGKAYMWMKKEAVDALPGAGDNITNYKWADVSQALVVKFTFDAPINVGGWSYKKLQENSYTSANAGTKLSSFCAGCHVDYMVHSGDADGNGDGNGTYTFAYRHSTDSASYVCLRCHFAHGTDVTIMKDAMDRTVADLTAPGAQFEGDEAGATAYMLDQNPSSALKRYTNMAVCWKCHTSSHAEQFLSGNADFYNNWNDRPHGF